jgi:hypothetical protein
MASTPTNLFVIVLGSDAIVNAFPVYFNNICDEYCDFMNIG